MNSSPGGPTGRRAVAAAAAVLAGVFVFGAGTSPIEARTLPARAPVLEDLGAGRAVVDGHRTPRPWARQTLGHLTARWGDANRIIRGRESCVAVWSATGVIARMANHAGGDPCSARGGLVQTLETRGYWRTRRGLTVGSPTARIARLYPRSVRGRAARIRLLRPHTEPCIGSCGGRASVKVAAVSAIIKNGRVDRFVVRVGAAGE